MGQLVFRIIMDDMRVKLFLVFLLINFQVSLAQNNRLATTNNIGWYSYTGTFKVSEKLGIHTEYQWRRNEIITSWQQSLIRTGLNYNPNAGMNITVNGAIDPESTARQIVGLLNDSSARGTRGGAGLVFA